MAAGVKQEKLELSDVLPHKSRDLEIISLSSSSDFSGFSSDDSDDEFGSELNPKKKLRIESVLPVGFLDPIGGGGLSSFAVTRVKEECGENVVVSKEIVPVEKAVTTAAVVRGCKQFWKAGDYEGATAAAEAPVVDMDHVRVHPRFLHSNATSHKWALGAFAELLDNALDEACNGATYVKLDVIDNMKDKNKMVVVQDNGGGMTPEKMRQCMSLGYSAKSKIANTIGQYGNGFKTSTMRLGADVIVFSRSRGKNGGSTTRSIGLLSYTFLQNTGKEDIVVPMIDYEKNGQTWTKRVKSSYDCWHRNLETIVQWSPYESEEHLLKQFDSLKDQGTRIIIYNLWEDDQGSPELDFNTDKHDIQIRGVSRDEKKIEMAKVYPSSKHFLTFRHSLRSYTSILYRRIPPNFRIILRGVAVEHHDIVNDLTHIKEIVYRPAASADIASKDPNMMAVVTLGFIKDASHHIDVQGFNVYHKNRLIKPFWRVWNAAGSDGRGVIGVLEANFVEPAHDKQGFERTVALSRLEARLKDLQKNYWSSSCHLVGYAQRRQPKKPSSSPEKKESSSNAKDKCNNSNSVNQQRSFAMKTDHNINEASASSGQEPQADKATGNVQVKIEEKSRDGQVRSSSANDIHSLKNSLKNALQDLHYEKDKNKSLESQLQDMKVKMEKMDQEQDNRIGHFLEERSRREQVEENLRIKLKEASDTIEGLLRKVKILEASRFLR